MLVEEWLANIYQQVAEPTVTGSLRLFVVEELRGHLKAAAAIAVEADVFETSGRHLPLYRTFVAWCIANKASLDQVRAFVAAGDQSQSVLQTCAENRQAMLDTIANCKFTHTEGYRRCPKCHKVGEFATVARQTRSADEGMTAKLVCNACGAKFTM